MLKRSKLLVAFLVVTVLCAGIGFAAVSDSLTIDGTLAFNADSTNQELVEQVNTNVYFVQDSTTIALSNTNATGANAVVSNVDGDNVNDKLTITIPDTALLKKGDKAVVTATIKNENTSSVALAVEGAAAWNEAYGEYIEATVTGATTISGGNSNAIVITFEVVKVPSESISANIAFTVTATTND